MTKFSNRKLRSKVAFGASLGAAVIAGGAVGFAYFTGSGNGTGQATVGDNTGSVWTVAQKSVTGSMYPGGGKSVVTFTITNGGTGYQALELGNLAALVNDDGHGNITENKAAVVGCLQSWFQAATGDPTPGYGTSLAPTTGSATDDVTVTMSDSGGNQDICKGHTPDVTLTVTHS